MLKIPWLSLSSATLIFLVSWFGIQNPVITEFIWYSRDGLGQGELWRLVGGHLVHLSWEHLIADVLVFTFLAAIIEIHHRKRVLIKLCLGLGIGISTLLYCTAIDMEYFAGISAINYGLLSWLALNDAGLIRRFNNQGNVNQSKTNFGYIIISLLILHCSYQGLLGKSVLSGEAEDISIMIAWQAHLVSILMVLFAQLFKSLLQGKVMTAFNHVKCHQLAKNL